MSDKMMVDEEALREQVRVKYREVATDPNKPITALTAS